MHRPDRPTRPTLSTSGHRQVAVEQDVEGVCRLTLRDEPRTRLEYELVRGLRKPLERGPRRSREDVQLRQHGNTRSEEGGRSSGSTVQRSQLRVDEDDYGRNDERVECDRGVEPDGVQQEWRDESTQRETAENDRQER